MGSGYANNAGVFLVNMFVGLYVLVVLLRYLLQLTQADFYNPVSQFLVKATNPPLAWLRRLIPSFGALDAPTLILLLCLQMLEIGLKTFLLGYSPTLLGLVISAVGVLLKMAIYILVTALFARAIMSWFTGAGYPPLAKLVYTFTEPVLRPAQRILPSSAGIDLSPIAVFIALMLVMKLIVQPLLDFGGLPLNAL
ncbi:MAG: YggT family protein [Arenicellales bacterium]|jgi:YggT family protein|nr:YggT family protein [Arenicellales bacterium]|tara:strand:- start:288 stop:872 length:585 start_codon:yes stop_codon:yes gene_type:complete